MNIDPETYRIELRRQLNQVIAATMYGPSRLDWPEIAARLCEIAGKVSVDTPALRTAELRTASTILVAASEVLR